MRGPPLNVFSLLHDKEKSWSKRIRKHENRWVESVLWSNDSNNEVHNVLNANRGHWERKHRAGPLWGILTPPIIIKSCNSLEWVLYMHWLNGASKQSYKMGTGVIPTWQVKKPTLKRDQDNCPRSHSHEMRHVGSNSDLLDSRHSGLNC